MGDTFYFLGHSTNTGAFVAEWMILGIGASATFEEGFE